MWLWGAQTEAVGLGNRAERRKAHGTGQKGLHPELPTLTMATPAEAPTPNGKNKVSSIKMQRDILENKSFLKMSRGLLVFTFLLFNAIKMIFF